VRSSLARPQPSLAYQVSATESALPTLDWLGPCPLSANELLAATAPREHGRRDLAAYFLEQFLAAGPRTARDIWEAAQKAGLCKRTLQRAKRTLGIRCRRVHKEGRQVSYWLLRDQELPAEFAVCPDYARWLAQMENLYAPPTPLDEEAVDGGPG